MNETLKTIHDLRSTHGNFSDKKIPIEDFEKIIQATLRAASASAMQSYSIILLETPDRVREVTNYKGNKGLVFCVDYNKFFRLANHLAMKFEAGGTIDLITGSIDTILAAQTACIAARSLGIDSLFTNSLHRRNLDDVFNMLKLPEKYCFPLISLVLGYADSKPEFKKGRLEGSGVIHRNSYEASGDSILDMLIKEYDDKDRHLGLIQDWEDKGFSHYLEWFFKSWVSLGEGSRAKSLAFEKELRKRGFLL